MARIRSIKPESWRKRPGKVSLPAQNLWVKLITFADDAGRFPADVGSIVGHGYPHQLEHVAAIPGWLDELVKAGLLALYDHDGDQYGVIPKFRQHQVVNKPTQSRLPEPPRSITGAFRYDSEIVPVVAPKSPNSQELREHSGSPTGLEHGTWNVEQGTGNSGGGNARGLLSPNEVDDVAQAINVLVAVGFDRGLCEVEELAIARALRQAGDLHGIDWNGVVARLKAARASGACSSPKPAGALMFLINGHDGLRGPAKRLPTNLFARTAPAHDPDLDRFRGIG